jgi:hypothetical protein
MAKLIQNGFSIELRNLLQKYKKTITADKYGIHLIDSENLADILIKKPTTASDYFQDELIFVNHI